MGELYGSIEGGGTKFVCTVASGPHDIRDELRYPTTAPDETIGRAIAFFEKQQKKHGRLSALGIGSFGPIDVDPDSPTWGYVTSTPKAGWSNTDFVGRIRARFDIPIAWDTDVNAAALGEHVWGAAKGLDTFIYITVGTGFGGGGMVRGKLMHGLVHPEMGHIALPHDHDTDPYPGRCPFHGDCLEGMAAGPAISERWGVSGKELPPDHEAWVLEAEYLALGLRTFVCTLSPQRIIMGGGVMQVESLFPLVRARLQKLLNGYVQHPSLIDNIDNYVVPPALGKQAGMLGGVALAQRIASSG
ncbi:MAG: ROK family protein [Candidatus Krumholzibacteria bacterium]|nr:ROK family protein [Candidatus Krumholzibacteria bacterium]